MPCTGGKEALRPVEEAISSASMNADADDLLFSLEGDRSPSSPVTSRPTQQVSPSRARLPDNAGIDPSRRALLVELPEEDGDVCSICLDPYSDSDPAVQTCCKCELAAY